MILVFLKMLLVLLILVLCYFYFQRKETFDIQQMSNAVIYFVTANSAWMTAACTLMYSGVVIGSFFPVFQVDRISSIIYLPQSLIALSYGMVWGYEYFKIKKRPRILTISILHLSIAVVNTVIYWQINANSQYSFSLAGNGLIENILILMWFALFFSFVLWHLWAPFRMNWKKWLSTKDDNVFFETFNVFFFMAFPFSHYILIVMYTGFNQPGYLSLFLLAISLFIMFSLFDIIVWSTTAIMPRNRFFRSFKAIFFVIFPAQCAICFILIIGNLLKVF
jgi:hypothetical protein